MGNLIRRVKEAYEVFCDKQSVILVNFSDFVIQEEAVVYGKWLYVVSLEEEFFKQKVKFYWLDIGD